MVTNVIVAGLGGQGVLKVTDILSEALFRCGYDIKKSEAYESGFLEGTVPMYDAYIGLKKSIICSRKGD